MGPLDRVKILFQASNPKYAKYTGSWLGAVTAMQDIHRQSGLAGLFRGHSATLLRIFPYAAIKFLAYEQFRSLLITRPGQETPVRRLLSGSLAGMTSVCFTYPLEIIRVRLAFETKTDGRANLHHICSRIYHETSLSSRPGLANFYRGFSPTLAGMLPYAGMSFLTHDMAIDLLRAPSLIPYTTRSSQLTSWAELVAGGIAGLVSQTVAYPLEVVRRRMQVGGAVGDGHRMRIAETAAQVWSERGWRGFFVGLGIGYVKVVPMVAVSFFVYGRSKHWLGI